MESFGNGFFNETASSGAVELKNVLKLEDYKGTSYTGYLKKLFTMRRIPKEDFPIQTIMQQNAERQSEMLECMSEDPTWEEIEQYVEEYCMINAKTWQSELVDVLKMEKQWGETPREFFRRLERSAAMLIGRKDPKDVLLIFASRMPKSAHKYLLQVKDFSEASLIHAWTQSMEEKKLLTSESGRGNAAVNLSQEVKKLEVNKSNDMAHFNSNGNSRRFTCYTCGMDGHTSRFCPSRVVQASHEIRTAQLESSEGLSKEGMAYKIVRVNGADVRVLLDSGAEVNGLCVKDAKRLNLLIENVKGEKLLSADGNELKCLGQVEVSYSDLMNEVTLTKRIVVMDASTSWLSAATARQLNIDINAAIKEANDALDVNRKVISDLKERDFMKVATFLENNPHLYDESETASKLVVHLPIVDEKVEVLKRPISAPYPLKSKELREKFAKTMERNILRGHWQRITHPVITSPCSVVEKKDSPYLRLCLDGRKINSCFDKKYCAINLPSPVKVLNDLKLDEMSENSLLTTLDLQDAFMQVKIPSECNKFSTVSTIFGMYACTGLQFGWNVSSKLFHEEFNKLIMGIPNCTQYVDDVVISGRKFEQEESVLELLRRLSSARFKLNLGKCHFFQKNVQFLGNELCSGSFTLSGKRKDMLSLTMKPSTVKEAQEFVGKYQYVSSFIPSFASIIDPLYPKTSDQCYVWSDEREKSFNMLKLKLEDHIPLGKISADCDVLTIQSFLYNNAFSVVLLDKSNRDNVILCDVFQRKFTDVECRYSEIEKMLLSLHDALLNFRYTNGGLPFVVESSSLELCHLLKKSTPFPFDSSKRIQRLMVPLVMEEIVAHHVTRDKLLQSMILNDRNFEIRRVSLPQFTRVLSRHISLNELQEVNNSDNQIQLAIKNLEMKEAADLKELNSTVKKNFDLLRIENNALMVNDLPYLPDYYAKLVMERMHSDLHCGSKYLQNVFDQVAVTVGTIKLCQEVVKSCELCSVFRNRCRQKLRSWIAPLNSRERAHVDLAELDGMLMFVFTDTYSGAIIMKILRNKSAQSIVETLMSIFAYFGVWQVMISDNEWCFQNSYVDEFLESYGVLRVHIPIYSPVTNGSAERAVQSVKKTVKKLLEEGVNKRCLEFEVFKRLNHSKPDCLTKFYETPKEKRKWNSEWVILERTDVYYKRTNKTGEKSVKGVLVAKNGERLLMIETLEEEMIIIPRDRMTDCLKNENESPDINNVITIVEKMDLNNNHQGGEENDLLKTDMLESTDQMDQDVAMNSEALESMSDTELKEAFATYKNVIAVDGSIYDGSGLGAYGCLDGMELVIQKRNGLRGAMTAPRAEVEAYLMILRVLADGTPDDGTRKKTLIISDCSYVTNAVTRGWMNHWILTGKNSSNQPCAHLNQWKEIQSLLLKLGDDVTTKHVPGHTYQFHDCADKLARGDEKLANLNNIWKDLGTRPSKIHPKSSANVVLSP
uniref:CCHC-type domain-containing protein n=1 Tax=Strongyloides venezuelensis TaxID=75913 RepID=A0A0K0EWP1_STRVS